MQFQQASDITQDWVDYFEMKRGFLSEFSETELSRQVDEEVTNPDLQEALSKMDMDDISDTAEELSLGFRQVSLKMDRPIKVKFRKLKKEIRKYICTAISEFLDEYGNIDWKKVIRSVIEKVLQFLLKGNIGKVPEIVYTIIIILIAVAGKMGYQKFCELPN